MIIQHDDAFLAVMKRYQERAQEEQTARKTHRERGERNFSRDNMLLAVGPNTAAVLNAIARSLDAPHILEIGTSYGYSTMWLADAARASGGKVTTLELEDFKSNAAEQTAKEAGLEGFIDFKIGDAVALIDQLETKIDFILLDLWKNLYEPCYRAFLPKLNPGAIIVADNMVRPGGEGTQLYAQAIANNPDFDSVLLPVGTGIEVSRYMPK